MPEKASTAKHQIKDARFDGIVSSLIFAPSRGTIPAIPITALVGVIP